jgi:hypothetical protein
MEAESKIEADPTSQVCVSLPLPPPRSSGPDTTSYSFYDTPYPGRGYVGLGIRLGAELVSLPSARMRMYGGVNRLLQKSLTVPSAALSLSLGTTRRFLIDAERTWIRVPLIVRQDFFENGVFVARRDHIVRVGSKPLTVRFGLELPF